MHTSDSLYHRHRFPAEIISHCVWLYFRFALSFRDVEEMLAMRGIALTYETVREWCLKFGQTYANGLRLRSPRPGDRWHLDEVFLKIKCCRQHLIFYGAPGRALLLGSESLLRTRQGESLAGRQGCPSRGGI